eukprot:3363547-Amphidinium_carterae.2
MLKRKWQSDFQPPATEKEITQKVKRDEKGSSYKKLEGYESSGKVQCPCRVKGGPEQLQRFFQAGPGPRLGRKEGSHHRRRQHQQSVECNFLVVCIRASSLSSLDARLRAAYPQESLGKVWLSYTGCGVWGVKALKGLGLWRAELFRLQFFNHGADRRWLATITRESRGCRGLGVEFYKGIVQSEEAVFVLAGWVVCEKARGLVNIVGEEKWLPEVKR